MNLHKQEMLHHGYIKQGAITKPIASVSRTQVRPQQPQFDFKPKFQYFTGFTAPQSTLQDESPRKCQRLSPAVEEEPEDGGRFVSVRNHFGSNIYHQETAIKR